MADYEVFTRTIIERCYKLSVPSQFENMEDVRLTDTAVRKAVAAEAIDLSTLEDDDHPETSDETITTIMRDGKTIWEHKRTHKAKLATRDVIPAQTSIEDVIEDVIEV